MKEFLTSTLLGLLLCLMGLALLVLSVFYALKGDTLVACYCAVLAVYCRVSTDG